MPAQIDDTYAEAFRSLYTEFLITARDQTWVRHAVDAAVGNAASTILCDCEAGLDRFVGPGGDESFETPDGRPGAIVQLHVPRFWKDRVEKLERAALVRISQNRVDLPDGVLLQPAGYGRVLPDGPEGGLFRQWQATPHRTFRTEDVVGADPGR